MPLRITETIAFHLSVKCLPSQLSHQFSFSGWWPLKQRLCRFFKSDVELQRIDEQFFFDSTGRRVSMLFRVCGVSKHRSIITTTEILHRE